MRTAPTQKQNDAEQSDPPHLLQKGDLPGYSVLHPVVVLGVHPHGGFVRSGGDADKHVSGTEGFQRRAPPVPAAAKDSFTSRRRAGSINM